MTRLLLAVALAAGFVAASAAQDKVQEKKKDEKKAQPKKARPPKFSVSDLEKMKEQPDFAVQGEYEGKVGDAGKIGAQVVALGDGKFQVAAFHGGLPGAGAEDRRDGFSAAREGGKIAVYDAEKRAVGEIADGAIAVKVASLEGTLKRVERKSPTLGVAPPAGAVVLFANPGDEANWANGKLVELSDGKYLGVGVKSKQQFGSFKLHVEFRLPWMPQSKGQARGNSGVYLQDRYEVQVLDSFGLKGENNECGGIYTQHKPAVNMCLPPMVWQTYDIDFTAAEFAGDKKVKPARVTIVHNGVTIHDNVELKGPTGGGQPEKPTPGPIQLQNHGDPVVFRNVWVAEKK